MDVVATKVLTDAEEVAVEAAPRSSVPHGFEIPEGFVPATRAQVAYWRQLCGAISERGTGGMRDANWPPDLAPTRFTLRAMEERRLVVRRARAWHLRRGWYTRLSLLRATAVPTPPLRVAERPASHLPTFAELEIWEKVCRWLDQQPKQRTRLPIFGVPGLPSTSDVSAELLRGMRSYRLVRHGADCTWRLSPSWKQRLLALWQGVTKAEGERQPSSSDAPTPYSVTAGIDTWYLNWIDEGGLPPHLRIALDDLQAQAKDDDDEVETPWMYDGVSLVMYQAGVNTNQGGGVSWFYILRNPSLTLLMRKASLGGIVVQARLGSECLWRRTPRAALDELNLLVRRLWRSGGKGGIRQRVATSPGRWQVSQVHLAHDVAHAPLELDQLSRYVSRSRKQAVFEAARQDLQALYRGLRQAHPSDAFLDADEAFETGFDWDALYDDPAFGDLDPFEMDEVGGQQPERDPEPTPAEERAVLVNRFGRRLSGVTWSPGAAVSFVAYDKVLEGRLRGKSHMEPIWRANGWDEQAPVTRHEAWLRRDASRELGLSDSQVALFDDPWQMLEHQQDLFGYAVGRPNTATPATDCLAEVDVVWLRRVLPEEGETNRSRWPIDPTWAVVQAASFTEAPVEARHLIRREVRSSQIEKRDVASYGLLVSRTAIACADPKHWNLDYAMAQLYRTFEKESQKPGKMFHEVVRRRRRDLGLPAPPEERVLPFRMQPSEARPALDLLIDHDAEEPNAAVQVNTLALLRTERRMEELDIQLGGLDPNTERVNRKGREELAQAFEQECLIYGTMLRRRDEWEEGDK